MRVAVGLTTFTKVTAVRRSFTRKRKPPGYGGANPNPASSPQVPESRIPSPESLILGFQSPLPA
jgi:hypothetical protein